MSRKVTTAVSIGVAGVSNEDYSLLLKAVRARFKSLTSGKRDSESVFTTNVDGDVLYASYLDGFTDPTERQYHTCHCCKTFLRRFGSLVVIDESGQTAPLLWEESDAPDRYRDAVAGMAKLVRKAKVTGVFLSGDKELGVRKTGEWTHFSVVPPAHRRYASAIKSPSQAMAEKKEDFLNVTRALADFNEHTVTQALVVVESDALYRSEKVLGPVKFLKDLQDALRSAPKNLRSNLIWRAIASAPAGFCHPRSSMAGSLMEDIAAGMGFDDVSRRFAAKMHPLQYQRPQAAPTAGNIAEAEKVIAKMAAAGSLARRFAKIDEVVSLWTTKADSVESPKAGGVFANVKSRDEKAAVALDIPATVITWRKFQEEVLPGAEKIEFYTPSRRLPFSALVTAVDPDAPPILQWDAVGNRNPVSWYVWHGGSTAEEFSLRSNQWQLVDAVAYQPSMWRGEMTHQGRGVMFILRGARETRMRGSALFPEILKSELHGIRAVIEAYSRGAEIAGLGEPMACGVLLQASSGEPWLVDIRVTSGTSSRLYRLDRWD